MGSSMNGLTYRVIQRLIRISGRHTIVDPHIPASALMGEASRRLVDLLRGLLRTRRFIFLGSSVKFLGKRHFDAESGVRIGDGVLIDARGSLGVKLAKGSSLGRNGMVTTTSHLSKYGVGFALGRNSGLGDTFHIGASGGVFIGNDVIIGSFFAAHSQEHNYANHEVPIRLQGTYEQPVTIHDNCWIGSKVTFLSGASIGPHSVVASGSVVRDVFPGHVLIGGVPAKVLKTLG